MFSEYFLKLEVKSICKHSLEADYQQTMLPECLHNLIVTCALISLVQKKDIPLTKVLHQQPYLYTLQMNVVCTQDIRLIHTLGLSCNYKTGDTTVGIYRSFIVLSFVSIVC